MLEISFFVASVFSYKSLYDYVLIRENACKRKLEFLHIL